MTAFDSTAQDMFAREQHACDQREVRIAPGDVQNPLRSLLKFVARADVTSNPFAMELKGELLAKVKQ